jgi:hypothetical protein
MDAEGPLRKVSLRWHDDATSSPQPYAHAEKPARHKHSAAAAPHWCS